MTALRLVAGRLARVAGVHALLSGVWAAAAGEANALTERIAREQRRDAEQRDLSRAEEWPLIARAVREVLEVSG